jgi:glycerophosphoryl diester phosphodiesterase
MFAYFIVPAVLVRTLITMFEIPSTSDRSKEGKPDPTRPNIPLKELSGYADVVAPIKVLLVSPDGTPTAFVEQAHRLGLEVHVWTLRNDTYPTDFFSSAEDEQTFFFKLGIDAVFTDFPDTGVAVRDRLFPKTRPVP